MFVTCSLKIKIPLLYELEGLRIEDFINNYLESKGIPRSSITSIQVRREGSITSAFPETEIIVHYSEKVDKDGRGKRSVYYNYIGPEDV